MVTCPIHGHMVKMDASGGIVSGGLNITDGGKIWIFFSLMFMFWEVGNVAERRWLDVDGQGKEIVCQFKSMVW